MVLADDEATRDGDSVPLHSSRFSRRRLLVGAGAVGAAGLVAAGAVTRPWEAMAGSSRRAFASGQGTLVLATLYGGNDGLNTVVPYTDPAYHAGRPTLGYQPDQVLPIGDGLALNAQLKGMKSLWDDGRLAVIRGVSYPEPSLSHFQAMDIWQTANPSDDSGSGWLGRWLDASQGDDPLRAISVGAALPTAMRGTRTAAAALTSSAIRLPGRSAFERAYTLLGAAGADRTGLAGEAATTSRDLLAARADLDRLPVAGGAAAPRANSFAEQLDLVSSLVKAGAPTRVYQVSLSSFDTHADEKTNHEQLLLELDGGISGFFAGLRGSPHENDVVLMTYSEFGRRVDQNASGGTDHGTAAPLFVAGAGVKGGHFYGEEPSLTRLDPNGNLVFNVDFRSVYATMLEQVVGVDAKPFLGGSFPTLSLL